jgi:hypothetical protein
MMKIEIGIEIEMKLRMRGRGVERSKAGRAICEGKEKNPGGGVRLCEKGRTGNRVGGWKWN